MKKFGLLLMITLTGSVLVWFGWMSLVNSRLTRVDVRVTGAVDEVSLFRTDDPAHPVAVIQTNGVDTTQVVNLRSSQAFSLFYQTPPDSYGFSIRSDDSVFPGKKICCENGLFTDRSLLTISGPTEWDLVDE